MNKIQINNGLINDLPSTAIVAVGVGDIEVEPIEGNYFDYDYINGQLVRMRWSDWHEHTKYKIKFAPDDLLDMIETVPNMVGYSNNLTVYKDLEYRLFYVNYFNDMERELIEYFGGIITERENI